MSNLNRRRHLRFLTATYRNGETLVFNTLYIKMEPENPYQEIAIKILNILYAVKNILLHKNLKLV